MAKLWMEVKMKIALIYHFNKSNMRPTQDQVNKWFDRYNILCFEGKLPRPQIKLNTRYGVMGLTKYCVVSYPNGETRCTDISIEISIRRDLPEQEYIDTIIHEMIHYYIAYNNLKDNAPHGVLFQQIMQNIINRHGIKITQSYNPDEDVLVNTIGRYRYICTAQTKDGYMWMSVIARNKVLGVWTALEDDDRFINIRWYISDREIFSQFPVSVTLRLMCIEPEKLKKYLTGAKEIVRTATGMILKL